MVCTALAIDPIESGVGLKARAYDALRRMLVDANVYATAYEIKLEERDLSRRLGVSRTPLREALAQLEYEGLIKTIPRRGIFVVRKTRSEIVDLVTVWGGLEGTAANLAAQRSSTKDLSALTQANADARAGVDTSSDDACERVIRFHEHVVAAGKCELLTHMASTVFIHIRVMRSLLVQWQDHCDCERDEIVAALAQRDADSAERLARQHIFRLRDHLQKNSRQK